MAILGHINLLIIDFSTFEQIIIKALGMLIISEFLLILTFQRPKSCSAWSAS